MAAAITIRPARTDDAPALTRLALKSKAHWGYDAEFMAACVAELTVTPDRIGRAHLFVAEREGRLVGMAGLEQDGGGWEVCLMFVDPAKIGTGLGRRLFENLLTEARRLGITELNIDADPNAEPFYQRMGAVTAGRVPSGSIKGRTLPQMVLRP